MVFRSGPHGCGKGELRSDPMREKEVGRLRRSRFASIFSLLVFALSILFPAVPTFAASDLYGHWAQAEIESLIESGVVQGYPDGSFQPDRLVTRAEFVTILNRAAKLDGVPSLG